MNDLSQELIDAVRDGDVDAREVLTAYLLRTFSAPREETYMESG